MPFLPLLRDSQIVFPVAPAISISAALPSARRTDQIEARLTTAEPAR